MDFAIPWPTNLPRRKPNESAAGGKQLPPGKSTSPWLMGSTQEVPSLVTSTLGPLEWELLACVCRYGELSARQALERVSRPLAYTTVMTTLTRLYRKGLLDCRQSGKCFVYASRFSSAELGLVFACDLVKTLIRCTQGHSEQAAGVIIEALQQQHPDLLNHLRQRLFSVGGTPASEDAR